jgi:PAS domain S-box-containing protein
MSEKPTYEDLHKELQMRTILLENIPDCIALILKKGTREIVASNKFAQDLGAVPGLTCFKTCSLRDDMCPWCLAPKLWETNQRQVTNIEYQGKWYKGQWMPLTEDLYVHYILDITERKHVEEKMEELLHDKTERIKELRCMFGVTDSIHKRNKLEDIFQDVAELLPPGWHYPEITRGKVVFDGKEYVSESFEETEWKQTCDILVDGKHRGLVEVYYMEESPEIDDGPFMKEERTLINGIARNISEAIERKQADEELLEGEERYRRIYENLQSVYYEAHMDGTLLEISPSIEKYSQYKKTELIGKSLYDLYVDPKEREEFVKLLLETGKVNDYEIHLKDKDGSHRHGSLTTILMRDDQGTPVKLIGSMLDISKRKQAEEGLRKSEARLKKAQSVAMMGNWEYDILTGKIWGSEEVFAIYGIERTSPQLPLDKVEACIPDMPRVNKALADLIQENKKYDIEYEIYRENSGESVFIHSLAELILENDIPIKVLGVIQDVTEKKDAEKEKKSLQTQLQQAQKMEAIGTLAGGIAHDFNNVLFPISGYTEMLLEDAPEGSFQRHSLNNITKAIIRAKDLVNQILTFSRQSTEEIKPLKMQFIVKEVLKLLRASLPTTINISQDISDDCEFVMVNSTQIHQIAMNLVTNAYHAMEEAGGELKITLKEVELGIDDPIDSPVNPGSYVCLTVSDTGTGMNQSIIDRIFDPYFTTKTEGKGTGLGLAVTYGIIKGTGGDIRVHSEPGKGTIFHVYIPCIKDAPVSSETVSVETLPSGHERVLLVDDENQIILMEKQMLERLGYHVTTRTSSIEAREAFREQPDKFDLVITDMTMPNMTGDKLAEEFLEIRPDIPIILCTGFSEKISKKRADAMGFKGFLMKPIVMKNLAKTIREALDDAGKSN